MVLIAAHAVGALKLSAIGCWTYSELKPPVLSISLIRALSWRPPTPHLEERAEEEACAFASDSVGLQGYVNTAGKSGPNPIFFSLIGDSDQIFFLT